jgi:hypothetical protein
MDESVPVEVVAEGQDERYAADLIGNGGHPVGDFGLTFTAPAACGQKFEHHRLGG